MNRLTKVCVLHILKHVLSDESLLFCARHHIFRGVCFAVDTLQHRFTVHTLLGYLYASRSHKSSDAQNAHAGQPVSVQKVVEANLNINSHGGDVQLGTVSDCLNVDRHLLG